MRPHTGAEARVCASVRMLARRFLNQNGNERRMAVSQALDRRPARISVDRTTLFVTVSIAAVTVLHYLTGAHFLPYHTIYRSLYYLPIAVAAVSWGLRGGLLASLLISALYLPHVF